MKKAEINRRVDDVTANSMLLHIIDQWNEAQSSSMTFIDCVLILVNKCVISTNLILAIQPNP